MLTHIIAASVRHRGVVLVAAAILLALGVLAMRRLPIDVLPDLTRPTVVVLTEAPGLAPEEVELRVTAPLERALQGLPGVSRVRSISETGLSQVQVEFDWSADLNLARTRVRERVSTARDALPAGFTPTLAPATSLLGNLLLVAVVDPSGTHGADMLRDLAETRLLPRLLAVPGVAEAVAQGGGRRHLLIEPDPDRLRAHGVSWDQVREVASQLGGTAAGGLLETDGRERLLRSLVPETDLAELRLTPVLHDGDRVVTLGEVAHVAWRPMPARGTGGVAVPDPGSGAPVARPAVILSVTKAPGQDTLTLTRQLTAALDELRAALPAGARFVPLYRQGDFIGLALDNLREALRDGAVLVALILLLMLGNLRVALITLTAIPLSLAGTLVVFMSLGLSLNAMTLGGLAVAVGLVVDDAIVDVENIARRLREGSPDLTGASRETVIVRAAAEVRASILFATLLILAAFLPLLGLHGIEGRLFAPIAFATMLCMAVSFVVALTVVPAASSLLLRGGQEPAANGANAHANTNAATGAAGAEAAPAQTGAARGRTPRLTRWLLDLFTVTCLRPALAQPYLVMLLSGLAVAVATVLFLQAPREFLPAWREPTLAIATTAAPGTSLAQTTAYADRLLTGLAVVPGVGTIGYRVGRAELGDHLVPVSTIEFDITPDPQHPRPRAELMADLRAAARTQPGTFSALSSPLADRLGHLLSGVAAPVVVKLHGPDLDVLSRLGGRALELGRTIPGLEQARLEAIAPVPQQRIEFDPVRSRAHGLAPGVVQAGLAPRLAGDIVGFLPEAGWPRPVALRLPEAWRDDPDRLLRLPLETPDGRTIPLGRIAELRTATGPERLLREQGSRRVALSARPTVDDIAGAAQAWQEAIERELPAPAGYHWTFEGDHAAQRAATRQLSLLTLGLAALVTGLLWLYFRSLRLVLVAWLNVPLALAGGVALHHWLVGPVSLATLVGLVAVSGIAARNSILLLSHFLHLRRHEGEPFGRALVIRGTRERLVPVLLTALTAALALLPLIFAGDAPGKELLHPVAVVIVGGLASSTLLGLAFTPTVFLHFLRTPAERSVARGSPASS